MKSIRILHSIQVYKLNKCREALRQTRENEEQQTETHTHTHTNKDERGLVSF